MRISLGEKIGEGASADVHAWAPGQVVKLFKSGVPRRLSGHELRMTRAIFAAGGPAPEVLDEVTLEGRFGIVLRRLDGPSLLQLTRTGAVTRGQAGTILATLCLGVRKTPPPPDVLALRDWIDAWLRSASCKLPKHIDTGIRALIERLSPGDGLCHGDLHPGNVIMTAEGPRLVDWSGSVRGPAAFDLAVSHIVLTMLGPEVADDPERPRAVNAALQSEYARLAGMPPATLTAAIEPYLPIVCVLVVLGDMPVTVTYALGCQTLPDVPSANVVAEIVGSEKPEEVVVIGGHLDSWDLGTGAIDDGAGCAIVMEAMRLIHVLDLKPRRTIRAVLFMNEENGLAGGKAYAADHRSELAKHVAAIESDSGAARPVGFGISGGVGAEERVREIAALVNGFGAGDVKKGGGGADISPMRDAGVPLLSLRQEGTHYFDYHHTPADTLDKVDPFELSQNAAAMAVMAYVLADMPDTLARQAPEPPTRESK